MGGRKPARIEKVTGSSKKIKEDVKDLKKSLRAQKPKKIVDSTIKLARDSFVLKNKLSIVSYFYNYILKKSRIPEKRSYKERKKIVTEFWINFKKENKIKTSTSFDKILIDSATKVIMRGELND